MSEHQHHHHDSHSGQHFILPNKISFKILCILLFLTGVTVLAAQFHFGALNFPIAMLIATVKALMVMLYFMGLKYDDRENSTIFGLSFAFLAVFIALTAIDYFSRGNVYVPRQDMNNLMPVAQDGLRFPKPWIETPELVAEGKKLYFGTGACFTCHGDQGQGDGIAAAALNPKPRNLSSAEGWIRGRKPSDIFRTLTNPEGLNGMPQFNTLPIDDRWALAWYVLSLGPDHPKDSESDLKAAGVVDPSKDDGGMFGEAAKQRRIPTGFAIDRYVEDSK